MQIQKIIYTLLLCIAWGTCPAKAVKTNKSTQIISSETAAALEDKIVALDAQLDKTKNKVQEYKSAISSGYGPLRLDFGWKQDSLHEILGQMTQNTRKLSKLERLRLRQALEARSSELQNRNKAIVSMVEHLYQEDMSSYLLAADLSQLAKNHAFLAVSYFTQQNNLLGKKFYGSAYNLYEESSAVLHYLSLGKHKMQALASEYISNKMQVEKIQGYLEGSKL